MDFTIQALQTSIMWYTKNPNILSCLFTFLNIKSVFYKYYICIHNYIYYKVCISVCVVSVCSWTSQWGVYGNWRGSWRRWRRRIRGRTPSAENCSESSRKWETACRAWHENSTPYAPNSGNPGTAALCCRERYMNVSVCGYVVLWCGIYCDIFVLK